jgi:DNA transposition AAA+ family ATPase
MRHVVAHPNATPQLVRNRTHESVRTLIERVHAYQDVGAIAGPSGVGKTYLAERLARKTAAETFYVSLPRRPARKEVLVSLLHELTGKLVNGETYVLAAMLLEALADRECIVIIDEVHGLDDVALDQLSHLHGHEDAAWTMLLVGAPKLVTKLERYEHLSSRCEQILEVPRLEGEDLVATIRGFHPWFAHSPHELILKVNAEECGGSLREWARFLRAVAEIHDLAPRKFDTVDRVVAAAAIHHRKQRRGRR